MIWFHKDDVSRYIGMDKRLDAAFCAIGILDDAPVGRFAIDENSYYMVQEYETRPVKDTKWETHDKYIDVQYIVKGREGMGVLPNARGLKPDSNSPENDLSLFSGPQDGILGFGEGDVMVFYPGEAHRPCVATGEISAVRKIVFKVRCR